MARTLTRKEKKFVNAVAEGKPGVHAALEAYDTDDYHTAGVIASQNLDKLKIKQALWDLGFNSDNAKRVVAEILNDETNEPLARLKAADQIFKVNSDYAPQQIETKNINVNIDTDIVKIAEEAAKLLKTKKI